MNRGFRLFNWFHSAKKGERKSPLYFCEKVKWAVSVPINDGNTIVPRLNNKINGWQKLIIIPMGI